MTMMSCLACRNASHAVQPTDARLMVFESVNEATTLWIKGEHFNLRSLCNNMWKAERLDGCSLVISRYSPPWPHIPCVAGSTPLC